MKSSKKIFSYLIIIILFMILPFIEWKTEFNMTFETFKNVINNADFVQQWHYLTYANSKVFILLYPIIITYFGIKDFFKIYHSGMLYSISERTEYSSYIKNTFIKIYANNSWVYSTFILLMLIVCAILFKFNESKLFLVGIGNIHYLVFVLISIILSIAFSIFILNIGLIATRYCKKFSIAMIVSYLLFISFAIISEIMIGSIVNNIINIDGIYNSFSIFNMVILDGNIYGIIIYSIILLTLSTYIVFKLYKNKDKVLIEYE